MNQFDNAQIETLKPLREFEALVMAGRFANTMPLLVHYFLSYDEPEVGREHIGFDDWNRSEYAPGERVQIFYKDAARAAKLTEIASPEGTFYSEHVTYFRQRYMFVERTDLVRRLIADALGAKSIVSTLASQYSVLELCSDVTEQAKSILDVLRIPDQFETVVLREEDWPQLSHNAEDTIRAYACGAPHTKFMQSRPEVYLPLALDDGLFADDLAFDTHVIWFLPNVLDDSANNLRIRNALVSYHENLFAAAASDPSGFETLCRAFNQACQPLHPQYGFGDSNEYAACLADHHSS